MQSGYATATEMRPEVGRHRCSLEHGVIGNTPDFGSGDVSLVQVRILVLQLVSLGVTQLGEGNPLTLRLAGPDSGYIRVEVRSALLRLLTHLGI